MCGKKGEDVVVKVAPGTVVREAERDEVLLELFYPGNGCCCCLVEEEREGMLRVSPGIIRCRKMFNTGHIVDGSGKQQELEFDAICLELEMCSPEIAQKPFIVAYNMMDLPEAYENWSSFKENLQGCGIETFCMTAVKHEGTHEVISATYKLLRETKKASDKFEGFQDQTDLNHVTDMVQKQRSSSISELQITRDTSCSTCYVNGVGLQRLVQVTNWRLAMIRADHYNEQETTF